MRMFLLTAALLALGGPAAAQRQKMRDEGEWVKTKPTLGDVIPDVTVYDSSGKQLKTSDLRGHYTVLTFGCLT
jgi:cytochrome oxidase Cu insertion factor (SCO1/SenC/PrrC family)